MVSIIFGEECAEDGFVATTKDGALRLTLSKVNPADNHNMQYRSGMVSGHLHIVQSTINSNLWL